MSTRPAPPPRAQGFFASLAVQTRVIGALILRELHTRYGRENIGYMWMLAEPMLLATVIGILHAANSHGTSYGGDLKPIPFGVLGYTTFILFRGIVNRAAGTMDANAPLLYHRQVTPLDVGIARTIQEFCGVFLTMVVIMTVLVATGLANPPVRPLLVIAAWGLLYWYALGQSLIITAITYKSHTIERLVHPYTYFMVGLSGSFFRIVWIPHPFREVLTYIPLTSMFELARYGWFRSTDLEYVFLEYVIGFCLVQTWIGLILLSRMRRRVHLA